MHKKRLLLQIHFHFSSARRGKTIEFWKWSWHTSVVMQVKWGQPGFRLIKKSYRKTGAKPSTKTQAHILLRHFYSWGIWGLIVVPSEELGKGLVRCLTAWSALKLSYWRVSCLLFKAHNFSQKFIQTGPATQTAYLKPKFSEKKNGEKWSIFGTSPQIFRQLFQKCLLSFRCAVTLKGNRSRECLQWK